MNETIRPFTAAAFNQFLAEKKLMGSHCPACQKTYLPPRAICPKCHSDQLDWVEMKGKGRLAAYTSVFIGPTFMNNAGYSRTNPYVTGIVETEEGAKISARITGVDARQPETILIGTPLTVEFLEEGEAEVKKVILAFRAAD
jgi:uncharacterized protein